MSDYKCPECGAPMNVGERRCANCDYELTDAEYTAMMAESMPAQAPATPTSATDNVPVGKQPAAAPESVMAHGNVDVSQHHSEDKSTHNIDNSQTVNNTNQTVTNTFIIMGGGAPLPPNVDSQTAAALEQAQRAQQQVQPTPHVAEPQPVQKPVQETCTSPVDEQKGIGAINGSRRPITVDPHRSGVPKWVWSLVLIIVVAVPLFLLFRPSKPMEKAASVAVEQTVPVKEKSVSQKVNAATTKTNTPKENSSVSVSKKEETTSAMTTEPAVKEQPVAQPKDPDFEAGMSAYNAKDGLAAVKAFKASNSKEAVYMLGMIYKEGCGNVSPNAMMAHKYFKQAADMGHKEAKSYL